MWIDSYLALVLKVAAGILAIQAPERPVSASRATAYAVAATYHGMQAGVDPYELVAIARNESDFVETMRGPDGKDCGLTQTRTTITRYSCRQLLRSYWLAFQEAAREMKEYAAACHGHADFDRCRMNHYNSGIRYAKSGFHGAYWLRVKCFAAAARAGVPVENACRDVQGRGDIVRVLRRASPPVRTHVLAVVDPRPAS
jgi:hypothetical protein